MTFTLVNPRALRSIVRLQAILRGKIYRKKMMSFLNKCINDKQKVEEAKKKPKKNVEVKIVSVTIV